MNMANKITVSVIGGDTKTISDVNTIGDIKAALNLNNYTPTLNGESTSDSTPLEDFSYVTLAAPVKGG
jgi:hypothetical protein